MNFAKPKTFWTDFLEQYWEKKPVNLPRFHDAPVLTKEEMFRGLVRAAETDGKVVSLKNPCQFFVENKMLVSDAARFFPSSQDSSVEAWVERVSSTPEVDGRDVCFHVDAMQSYSWPLFERMRQFARGLTDLIGLPAEKINLDVWLGNYRDTPFGVHKDTASTFHFVICGTKRMLAWPFERFERLVDPAAGNVFKGDYNLGLRGSKELRGDAIVLEGKPGDAFYFPTPYWHVAEGTGELTMSVTLGFYLESSPAFRLLPLLDQALGREPIEVLDPGRSRGPGRAPLPVEYERSLAELRALLGSGQLERQVTERWLSYRSSSGFSPLQIPYQERPLPEGPLRRDPDVELVFEQLGDELVYAANGEVGRIPASQAGRALLERLLAADLIDAGEELAAARRAGGQAEADVRQLLATLFRCRMLTPTE